MSNRILLPVSAPGATEEQQSTVLDHFKGLGLTLVQQESHEAPGAEGKLLYHQVFRLDPWGVPLRPEPEHGHLLTEVRHTPDQTNPNRVTIRVWYVSSPGSAVELDFQNDARRQWQRDVITLIRDRAIMASIATAAFSKRP